MKSLTLLKTNPDKTVIIIRLIAGGVFLSEGIQKFLFPSLRGAGRFERMGFPDPDFFASFVGVFEMGCGLLFLVGFVTRFAAVAMIINMLVAIIVTKVPILFGQSFGPFVLRELKSYGFWSMTHEARTDFAMLLSSLFLLIKGAGKYSVDYWLTTFRRQL